MQRKLFSDPRRTHFAAKNKTGAILGEKSSVQRLNASDEIIAFRHDHTTDYECPFVRDVSKYI